MKAEEKPLKPNKSRLFLQAIVVFIVLVMVLGPFIFTRPAFPEQEAKCISMCTLKGRTGSLVRQDLPPSSKPAAQKFDCVCDG